MQAPLDYWESWKAENNNLQKQVAEWSKHLSHWVNRYQYPDTLFIGKFEDLVGKGGGPRTLWDLSQFLDFPMDYERMETLWKKAMNMSSGVHREKLYFPQYTAGQVAMMVETLRELRVRASNDPHICSILDDYLSKVDRYVAYRTNATETP